GRSATIHNGGKRGALADGPFGGARAECLGAVAMSSRIARRAVGERPADVDPEIPRPIHRHGRTSAPSLKRAGTMFVAGELACRAPVDDSGDSPRWPTQNRWL